MIVCRYGLRQIALFGAFVSGHAAVKQFRSVDRRKPHRGRTACFHDDRPAQHEFVRIVPGFRRNGDRSQFDLSGDTADGYGCRGGRIGRERHRPFPAHEKSVRLRRLGLQIHRILSIGEPTVIDSVRESDAGGNVRHHHDFLRSGDQPGDRLGEARRSEGLFLIQRTVGIEYEYRHVLDRVFGFFQVFGSRAVRRNDSLGAGRLPVQRNGQGRGLPGRGAFRVVFSAGDR